MKKKNFIKILCSATLCSTLLIGLILPFSACTPVYQKEDVETMEPLNLDPETDEIVAYTNGGIPIRSHNANNEQIAPVLYMTLGTYDSKPVIWYVVSVDNNGFYEHSSPAGSAIFAEMAKDTNGVIIENLGGYGKVRLVSQCAFENSSGFGKIGNGKSGYVNGYFDWNYSSRYGVDLSDSVDEWFDSYTNTLSYVPGAVIGKLAGLNVCGVTSGPTLVSTSVMRNCFKDNSVRKAKGFTSGNYVTWYALDSYAPMMSGSVTRGDWGKYYGTRYLNLSGYKTDSSGSCAAFDVINMTCNVHVSDGPNGQSSGYSAYYHGYNCWLFSGSVRSFTWTAVRVTMIFDTLK